MEPIYYRRLCSRAWRETRHVWTAYRWWLSIAPPLVAILAGIARNGWSSILNASDVIIDGAAGAAAAFAGTWIISLLRSPKLLDEERATTISRVESQLAVSENEVSLLRQRPKRTAAEEYHYQAAKAALRTVGEEAKEILRCLRNHGQIVDHPMTGISGSPQGISNDRLRQLLGVMQNNRLVTRRSVQVSAIGQEDTWKIAEAMIAPLDELLYGDSE